MAYRVSRPVSVWIIIGINLLVLVATLISNDLYIFLRFIPANFLDSPWAIFTALFVHANFWHLFANMITLFFFGGFLYQLIGRNKFLLVYFAGGILGNIFHLLIALNTPLFSADIPAIGASGAVFAIAGVLVVLMPRLRVLLYFIIPLPLWVVVLIFMVIWSFLPGIAWTAHLGGLVLGLIAGFIFRRRARYYYYR